MAQSNREEVTMKREELKRLAEAATQGPWESDGEVLVFASINHGVDLYGSPDARANAAYIAAAHPGVLLDLLAQLDAAETALSLKKEGEPPDV